MHELVEVMDWRVYEERIGGQEELINKEEEPEEGVKE